MSEDIFLAVCCGLIGAIFGSFANVIIYRLPRSESIVLPASHCMSCGTTIKWFHNIPVIAWFFLGGKCAACGARFSLRYPFVELLMAALFVAAFLKFGLSYRFAEVLLFVFGLVVVTFIDFDHMILPDKFTISGIFIGLAGALFSPERSFVEALLGAVAGFGFLWLVAYLYLVFRGRDGMGGGDIKLIGWIGAVLGWKAIPVVILVSSLGGSLIGVALAFKTKDGMKLAIPFGPYLAGAALLYLFFDGQTWAEWYLSLHGL